MASSSANYEALDSEITLEELDLSHIKTEVESDSEEGTASSTEPEEQEETSCDTAKNMREVSVRCDHAMKELFKITSTDTNARLGSFYIVNLAYDFLKDYSYMSKHHKAVVCAQFRATPCTGAVCERCCQIFSGKGSHLFDLMNHIMSYHADDAMNLLIGVVEKYYGSFARMQRMLQSDTEYIYRVTCQL